MFAHISNFTLEIVMIAKVLHYITVNLFVFTPHVTVNTHNNFLIDFPSFLNTAIQKYNVLNN